jgi:hypothetical protein
MGLRASAVVRLEGALAHGYLSTVRNYWKYSNGAQDETALTAMST